MTYTKHFFAVLLIVALISPFPARSDILVDPDAPPPPPAATSTPEAPPPPIEWETDVIWDCYDGWEADGTPFTKCGLGRYRELCSVGEGIPDCHTFFEPLENLPISNVLFLPGIKGSRLYESEEKLWEPSGNEDIEDLFLDAVGRSASGLIHARVGDILSETFSSKFYASFFEDLDAAEDANTYGEDWQWQAGAYDWRLSLTDLVQRGARYDDDVFYTEANGTPYLEQLVRDLAAYSPTEKVTIVAHSNGGLVAKALMQKLGDEETAQLIDKVVFVGVPQSGAPQALAAALFGYGEALPFDKCADWTVARFLCSLLVDRPTARTFAEQAPMGYHLLPSRPYFAAIRDTGYPLVGFISMNFYKKEQAQYGMMVDTENELYDFALARDGGRQKPEREDTDSANVLSENLITYARDIHATLDAWTPPEGVEVYQIAGWGKDTLSGIQFYEKPGALNLFGHEEALYRPMFTEDGDGIVPVKSAHMMQDVKTFWVDLVETDTSHASLLEMPDVRTLIKDILIGYEEELPHISAERPDHPRSRRTMIFLHSPLTLGVRDSRGKYTGLNEDGSATEQVPGVTYGEFGEVKYLIVPRDKEYELVMHGTGRGTFTLEMLEYYGNDVSTTSSMINVPVTEDTVATMDVPSMPQLYIDSNGDGTTDIEIAPHLGGHLVYGPMQIPEEPEPVATTTDPVPEPEPEIPPTASGNSGNETQYREPADKLGEVMGTSTSPEMEEFIISTTTKEEVVETEEIPVHTTQTASALDAYTNAHEPITKYWWLLLVLPLILLLLLGMDRRIEDAKE